MREERELGEIAREKGYYMILGFVKLVEALVEARDLEGLDYLASKLKNITERFYKEEVRKSGRGNFNK